jgi:hypothetical protein
MFLNGLFVVVLVVVDVWCVVGVSVVVVVDVVMFGAVVVDSVAKLLLPTFAGNILTVCWFEPDKSDGKITFQSVGGSVDLFSDNFVLISEFKTFCTLSITSCTLKSGSCGLILPNGCAVLIAGIDDNL